MSRRAKSDDADQQSFIIADEAAVWSFLKSLFAVLRFLCAAVGVPEGRAVRGR